FITLHSNPTASPPSYTLSLHVALPICASISNRPHVFACLIGQSSAYEDLDFAFRAHFCCTHDLVVHQQRQRHQSGYQLGVAVARSEEHTSELQSRENLVCRLLREKKKR